MAHSRLLAAGLALIIAPILGVALRILAPGWLLMFLMIALIVLVPAYVLQVVIAATGFLSRRAVFVLAPNARRGVAAAWVAALSPLVAGFFALDVNDGGAPASPFLQLIGAGYEGEALVNGIAVVAVVAMVGGWTWLLVEWIIALRARRRVG